jgi:hypothetical protein
LHRSAIDIATSTLLPLIPPHFVSDWWKALDFFFSRAFFQGRSDKVSKRVYEAGKEVLIEVFEPGSSATERHFVALQARSLE